jgi:hypothetical protein
MQAANILAALQNAATAPALAGIYVKNVAISIARPVEHDAVLTIVWSMPDNSAAIQSPDMSMPGVQASVVSRPADTVMRLDRALASPAEIEDAVIACAWTVGAWDLARLESGPLPAGADWREPRYGLATSLGHNAYVINGRPLAAGYSAPVEACEVAAHTGLVTWRFVPLALATPTARQRWAPKDSTLLDDCTRDGEPHGYRGKWMHPTLPATGAEHQYQLGRGNHGNRSKASRERRA